MIEEMMQKILGRMLAWLVGSIGGNLATQNQLGGIAICDSEEFSLSFLLQC